MKSLHRIVKVSLVAAAVGLTSLLVATPTAEAGRRSGGVSVSVGFPIGDRGYVTVGSYRAWGHRHHGHGYHAPYRYGYRDWHCPPRYVRPISRVCYDPYPYSYRSYRSRVIVHDTPGIYRYAAADDLDSGGRVYNLANDAPSYRSTASLVAESSLPADRYAAAPEPRERSAERPTYRQQHRRATAATARPAVESAGPAAGLDDAYAMLERGEDAQAQRAFAGLIARHTHDLRATAGYGLASAALGQVERAERAFARVTAARPGVWDELGAYPAARSMAATLLRDRAFAESTVMRAPLERLSVAAEPTDPTMPDFERVAGGR